MPDVVLQLLTTEPALDKLGARGISLTAAEQVLRNRHVLIRNVRGHSDRPQRDDRRLLIGETDGGQRITLVIEGTVEPTTWLLVTGWEATPAERKILKSS